MAKLDKWEAQHRKDLNDLNKKVAVLYDELVREAVAIGMTVPLLGERPFRFSNYPHTKARADKLLDNYQENIKKLIVNGIEAQWSLSNRKNDELCRRVLGKRVSGFKQMERYFNNNDTARDAFIRRKDAEGLNLSERVWRYREQFREEIEMGLDVLIRDGLPAGEMNRELNNYLREPGRLFRRVRDQHGQLQLSKHAASYHPGQGVYRSSVRNIERLTRTETNMAYREADYERWQQLDFVVGIEIHLSHSHPYPDICDELKGKYPKDFKFTGWHPQCMCYATVILKTAEELSEDTHRILSGGRAMRTSANRVIHTPPQFSQWNRENESRTLSARQQPYFIRDNMKYIPASVRKKI